MTLRWNTWQSIVFVVMIEGGFAILRVFECRRVSVLSTVREEATLFQLSTTRLGKGKTFLRTHMLYGSEKRIEI